MDKKILKKIFDISEQFFGTSDDPEQIPVLMESLDKLMKLSPKSFLYKLDKNEPVSWVVIVPTSKELMDKFLNSEITERELLDKTKPQKKYGALYICAAFTVPEYRRKGYAMELFREAIDGIPHTSDAELFAWPVSQEGDKLAKKMKMVLGRDISIKK